MNFRFLILVILPILTLVCIGVGLMIMTHAYIWLLSTVVFWVFMSGFGIASGFHRIYSHGCYNPRPWLDNLLLFFGTIACQSSSITWVATHIGYHHPHADTQKDPHSPIKGRWFSFIGWIVHPSSHLINHKYAVRLLRRPNHVFVHKNYFKLLWTFFILMLIINWQLFLYGYCIAALLSIVQDFSVNLFGHWPELGYRNFHTDDLSSNFPILGFFGWGQGWHNNHHMYPLRFNFGIKWWEFDPCLLFIPILHIGSYRQG